MVVKFMNLCHPPFLFNVVSKTALFWVATANRPLNTFPEALEAFRTAMSYRFVEWLNQNRDVFIAHKASLGLVWT